jgi:hypothetical protein
MRGQCTPPRAWTSVGPGADTKPRYAYRRPQSRRRLHLPARSRDVIAGEVTPHFAPHFRDVLLAQIKVQICEYPLRIPEWLPRLASQAETNRRTSSCFSGGNARTFSRMASSTLMTFRSHYVAVPPERGRSLRAPTASRYFCSTTRSAMSGAS